jgi:hypothetical protein
MHTKEHGVHRIYYDHEEVLGLPGICLFAISGPGVPNLKITPVGVETVEGAGSPEGNGKITFENGPEHRMSFPMFNPNNARLPNWETMRRPPPDPTVLPAIRTMGQSFGVHRVVFHAGLYRNEPTVSILVIAGPGIPGLRLTRDGVEPDTFHSDMGETGDNLSLHIAVTREHLRIPS